MNIRWEENGARKKRNGVPKTAAAPPKRVVIADDTTTADNAWRLACEGTALLWRGDFQNARQLLQAMGRRAEQKKKKPAALKNITEAFHLYRQSQLQRARMLGMLLIPVEAGHVIPCAARRMWRSLYRGLWHMCGGLCGFAARTAGRDRCA